jgi:GNAT superfamily N-acetyltransferase
MKISATVRCPIHDSFRVRQVAGLMDVPLEQRAEQSWEVELPGLDEPWQIGAIVGPSGSGKSTIAREAFGNCLFAGGNWQPNQALIDGFPAELPIKDVTQILTAVGFSQPPAWIKPYAVLSNGQKFRADLALSLLQTPKAENGKPKRKKQTAAPQPPAPNPQSRLLVYDEFTSVVDRTVAQIGSAAVAKYVRSLAAPQPPAPNPQPPLRFVAVSCHYDILDWLEPDWILDMASGELARGSLRQRPPIELEIHRAKPACWRLFKPHHYLSGSVPSAARYYLATWQGSPVALVVVGNFFGKPKLRPGEIGRRLISRLVVLPDYQGVGIGNAVLNEVARLLSAERYQVSITSGHPAMMRMLARSKQWRVVKFKPCGTMGAIRDDARQLKSSAGRAVCSAIFVGKPRDTA